MARRIALTFLLSAWLFLAEAWIHHGWLPHLARRRVDVPVDCRYMSSTEKGSMSWNPAAAEDGDGSLYDERTLDDNSGDVHIPSSGISVYDEMDNAQRDRFVSEISPIPGLTGVAQITSSPIVRYSFEPIRYVVALSPPTLKDRAGEQLGDDDTSLLGVEPTFVNSTFVMVDVPPFSPQLVARMRSYMGLNHTLAAILVTSRDAIHYDQAEAVFSNRRSDLRMWKQAFPQTHVIAYRLDIPRDCLSFISQRLDGYGPFAAEETTGNLTFVETGRPLTYDEWDYVTAQNVLSGKPPPDDTEINTQDDDDKYTPEAIRAREEGNAILAVYTPGHSFGSISFVFPKMNVCCSGFTLPVEDNRAEDNEGFYDTGPALDVRGYITTSRGGITRQMESARTLVKNYSDRFRAVLSSRGGTLILGGSSEERKNELLAIIDQYERLGKIYEQLGITSSNSEDDEA